MSPHALIIEKKLVNNWPCLIFSMMKYVNTLAPSFDEKPCITTKSVFIFHSVIVKAVFALSYIGHWAKEYFRHIIIKGDRWKISSCYIPTFGYYGNLSTHKKATVSAFEPAPPRKHNARRARHLDKSYLQIGFRSCVYERTTALGHYVHKKSLKRRYFL